MPEATIAKPDTANNEPVTTQEEPNVFGSDEVLWFVNGRWTELGYGISNTGGKNECVNPFVWEFVNQVGAELFELMHRESRLFRTALDIGMVTEIINLVQVARKRLSDNALLPSEPQQRKEHSNPTRREFVLYPVPYFDAGVRNADMRVLAQWGLDALTEAMQNSEADRSMDITARGFAASVGAPLQRILIYFATKYLGFTRQQAQDPAFFVKPDDYKKFDNTAFLFSTETTDERQDAGNIPTENDLRQIRGIKASVAMSFGRRWPTGEPVYLGGPVDLNKPTTAPGVAVNIDAKAQFFPTAPQPVPAPK